MKLKIFSENLWIYESELDLTKGILPLIPPKFFGRPTIRMCIIKKETGGLILYSPVKMDQQVISEINNLGPVDLILGSNIFHNTYLLETCKNFKSAKCLIAPKTAKRNPLVGELQEWDDTLNLDSNMISPYIMKGNIMNELFLFHKPTKTLVLTDFLSDMTYGGNLFEQLYSFCVGMYKKIGVPFYQKYNIKDKKAFKASLQEVLKLDFDKIILSHGKCIESNGKEILATSWDKILRKVK